jgi:uncharacterized protein YebE (UPF0316 family)
MPASVQLQVFLLNARLLSSLKQELAVGESFAGLEALFFVFDLSLVVKKLLHVLHLSLLACLLCFRIQLGLVGILQGDKVPHRYWGLLSWETIRRIGRRRRCVIFLRVGDLQFPQRAKQVLFY